MDLLFPLSALAEPWEDRHVAAGHGLSRAGPTSAIRRSRELSLNSGRLSPPLLGDLTIENRRPGDFSKSGNRYAARLSCRICSEIRD